MPSKKEIRASIFGGSRKRLALPRRVSATGPAPRLRPSFQDAKDQGNSERAIKDRKQPAPRFLFSGKRIRVLPSNPPSRGVPLRGFSIRSIGTSRSVREPPPHAPVPSPRPNGTCSCKCARAATSPPPSSTSPPSSSPSAARPNKLSLRFRSTTVRATRAIAPSSTKTRQRHT